MTGKIDVHKLTEGFSMKPFICFMLLLSCSLFACAASRLESRIERIRDRNPQWDEATVMKLATCQIGLGMTKEMVATSLGEPPWVNRKGGEEEWVYVTYLYVVDRPIVDYKFFVYFDQEGFVTRIIGNTERLGCPGR